MTEAYQALTFKISFFTAQFRKHHVKLYRDTYLMPLPSTISGMIGAILGIRRKYLKDFVKKVSMLCGSELLSFDGHINEFVRIFKFPRERISKILEKLRDPKGSRELLPVYKSISLFQPVYKIAVALKNENVYVDLLRRLRELDFAFDIYGGNDYNFVKDIWDIKEAKVIMSKTGRGYCPSDEFSNISPGNEVIIVSDMVLADVKEKFIFAYGGDMILKQEKEVVEDDESKVFVYPAEKFLVSELY